MRPEPDPHPDHQPSPPASASGTTAPEPSPAAKSASAGTRKPAAAKRPTAAARAQAEAARELAALQEQLDATRDAERSARLRADELAIVARKQSEMADELHAENRRLRDGEVREAVAPIIRGLSRLADEVTRLRYSAQEPGGSVELADLVHIDGRVHELLHDAGVTPLRPAPGDPFDVHLHEAAGAIPTEDPLEDRTIVAVRQPGLIRDDGRILRPAAVIVHRFNLTTPGAGA